jgi:catechol 2,3-dioxygenase-like lactoylglutathione lyase family enzyme
MQLVQVALSCRDLLATRRWYADCFGYLPAGEFDSEAYPDPAALAELQDLQTVSFRIGWAVDAQEFFQLELFQYRTPEARPLPPEWRACDVGYTTLGLHVDDFDAAVGRVGAPRVVGEAGARRACVRDPDGVLVELLEDDPRPGGAAPRPRPEVPVAASFVRASVPDLARAAAYFVDTVGLEPHDPALLHGPEHEALWGLDGATRRVELLAAGGLWLELVQYEDPLPAPWPDDYRISDLGILNVALGSREREEYAAVRDAIRAAGSRINFENDVGYGSFLYSTDDQGFSLELIHLDPAADAGAGFLPA